MNAQTTVASTDRLTKVYGDRVAVDKVSMNVRRGEVYGFLGPNGAGKTTTLRMLLGLIRPTSGTASAISPVGALIEGPGFFPYLSGRANLRTLARHRGFADTEVERVLERVDLASRGDDRFKGYSLGMKQRLGVAAALMGDPDLIVLDEPTNGLDPAGMADMRALVVDLARGGQTVLLSSHMLAEVQEICDRVGVISDGRLLREARVAEPARRDLDPAARHTRAGGAGGRDAAGGRRRRASYRRRGAGAQPSTRRGAPRHPRARRGGRRRARDHRCRAQPGRGLLRDDHPQERGDGVMSATLRSTRAEPDAAAGLAGGVDHPRCLARTEP
ncbi:ABC transporter ATP-binding protein [Nocardioides convexus]|uniref:ABC transporter ATP-binding protein n=1 Tax=Nocardioides convexus TaxID=2712224 RepID=UPI0024189468|nr:ABC transporter ATP-binding protein [Nocardioides convexus]